jgi:transcriptional regulator with XRE-family HTH domain
MQNKQEYRSRRIAFRLRAARLYQRITLQELSEKGCLGRNTCIDIENDSAGGNVSLNTVLKLAQALSVSPAWLAFGEPNPEAGLTALRDEATLLEKTRARRLDELESGTYPDDPDEDDDPGRSARRKVPIWFLGHQLRRAGDDVLPPLPPHYAPVLFSLRELSHERQLEVSECLESLIDADPEQRPVQVETALMLHKLLLFIVPKADHLVVELVASDLSHPDVVIRGMMALSLVIDSGLPLHSAFLRGLSSFGEGERRLQRAVAMVIDNMRRVLAADRRVDSP